MGIRKTESQNKTAQAEIKEIKGKIKNYPHLEEKIYLHLLLTLHEKKHVAIDDIYAQARSEAKTFKYDHETENPNIGPEHWSSRERQLIRRLTLGMAAKYLTPKELDNLIFSVVKRDYIYALENIANLTDVSFGVLSEKVREFNNLPSITPLPKEEVMGLRVSLIRHFISDQLEFIRVARHHITVRDLQPLVDSTLGSAAGHGLIGGKAAGMLLGYKIIQESLGDKYGDIIRIPESYYLRSDVFEDFLSINGLTRYQNQKYKTTDEIRNEYPAILEVFRNGQFPEYLIKQCRSMLRQVGKHPLVVRSSSLLEDNFKGAFSGKYQSVFLGNQGTIDQRLAHLLAAIGEVFASGLAPDPLIYRQERDLLDYDEKIGILIQKVVGKHYGKYFLPSYAGVALSRNDNTWSPRIKQEDGLLRMVMGLGTRAVDRIGDDYPRLVGLTQPTLRPEVSEEAIKRYSQTHVDVINLESNSFERIPIRDLWVDQRFPSFEQIFAMQKDGYLQAAYSNIPVAEYPNGVITFERLLKEGSFPTMMKDILKSLEATYKCPVDIEFSYDGEHFYLLQTRPMAKRLDEGAVEIPADISRKNILFESTRYINNAKLDNIEYVVFCDPQAYANIPNNHMRYQLARAVGKVNQALADKRFILMGPGRWGSNNIDLGIPVQYSEINNTKALIEVAYSEGDYTPEVSFGTHFFLDLVERQIHYLPLYPDASDGMFNRELLEQLPNVLNEIYPAAKELAPYMWIVDMTTARPGKTLNLRMNSVTKLAKAYFG
ncbi:PEP/pyruvate-binding domain-containing protein [Candidatus Neomarinimicrobiota bacterium]